MIDDNQRSEIYLAAVKASERLRDERLAAADQAHTAGIGAADRAVATRQSSLADRDRAYASASDARQMAHDIAYQEHQDRLAALQRHFGQMRVARGDPDAPHAIAWLATAGIAEPAVIAEPTTPPIGQEACRPQTITSGGATREAGAILSPSGAPSPIPFGRDPPRGTFTGSPASLADLKRRAVMTPAEREALSPVAPTPADDGRAPADPKQSDDGRWVHFLPDWADTRH